MDGKYFELFDSARVWADACDSYEEVLRWTFGRGSWRVLGVRNGFLSAVDSDGRVVRRPVWEIPEYATRLNSEEDFADSVVEEERLDFYRQLHEIPFEGVLCAFLVDKEGRFVDVAKIASGSLVDLCDFLGGQVPGGAVDILFQLGNGGCAADDGGDFLLLAGPVQGNFVHGAAQLIGEGL